jgi:hypothetical protein
MPTTTLTKEEVLRIAQLKDNRYSLLHKKKENEKNSNFNFNCIYKFISKGANR